VAEHLPSGSPRWPAAALDLQNPRTEAEAHHPEHVLYHGATAGEIVADTRKAINDDLDELAALDALVGP